MHVLRAHVWKGDCSAAAALFQNGTYLKRSLVIFFVSNCIILLWEMLLSWLFKLMILRENIDIVKTLFSFSCKSILLYFEQNSAASDRHHIYFSGGVSGKKFYLTVQNKYRVAQFIPASFPRWIIDIGRYIYRDRRAAVSISAVRICVPVCTRSRPELLIWN